MDNLKDLRMQLDIPIVAIPNMIDTNQELLNDHYLIIEELLTFVTQQSLYTHRQQGAFYLAKITNLQQT